MPPSPQGRDFSVQNLRQQAINRFNRMHSPPVALPLQPGSQPTVGWKRVAWPKLRPLPLESSREHLPIAVEQIRRDIEYQASNTLQKHNVLPQDEYDRQVSVEMRQEPDQPTSAIPTVLIITPWTPAKNESFKRVATDMAIWLTEWTATLSPIKIHVEVIAPELVQPIYYSQVGIPALSRVWDDARQLIYNRLQAFPATKNHLTCLALQKYGINPDIDANPPTVYISMDYKCKETEWTAVIAGVRRVLDGLAWKHVQVHMEHNLNMSTFDLLPPPLTSMETGILQNKRIVGDYHETAQLGDDIGPARTIIRTDGEERDAGCGTLGCFIRMKTATEDWQAYALTNHHVVRTAFEGFTLVPDATGSKKGPPVKGSQLWRVDEKGYYPNAKQTPVIIESPSRAKHNFTIAYIDQEIATHKRKATEKRLRLPGAPDRKRLERDISRHNATISELEVERQRKIDFFEEGKQVLGEIYATSGFLRECHGRKMDWALIKLDPSRPWSNDLPSAEDWFNQYSHTDAEPNRIEAPILDRTQSIEKGNEVGPVFKNGTTTGPTTGEFFVELQKIQLVDDEHLGDKRFATDELVFGPRAGFTGRKKFCDRGDSGSAVFDDDGGIVGLFFRGHAHDRSHAGGYGYITPIELVFEDIKQFSNGTITDIRIAAQ
ncbi:hypothetical protein F53441_14048 [Fusarium austroafricanum]|uniref:Peptidase S7 domain-containing protein n=1 Tax=Fusarium austroafricanum TaxID=2364996 RepID=A0A8H4JKB9_9HYPO|nr:hypothetical protein F53441_14048 [Fusarium austroafricanum]